MLTGELNAEGLAVVAATLGTTEVAAIIDTGFEGHLQLPAWAAGVVPRVFYGVERFGFADGSEVDFDVYVVGVSLGGEDVVGKAIFSPTGETLIGAKFLADYRLTIDYPAGTVTLERVRP